MVVYYRLVRRGGVQVVVMMIIQGISRLRPLHRRISVSAAAIGITAMGGRTKRDFLLRRSTNILF
jgi:hypothetical protein